jgi:hypothetical protein
MNDQAFDLLMKRFDRLEESLDRVEKNLETTVDTVAKHVTYWKIVTYVLTTAGSVSGAVAGYLGFKH